MFDRPDSGERALLVNLATSARLHPDKAEFRDLALSAGAEILDEVSCQRDKPSPRYLLGSGKVEEVHTLIIKHDVQLVLFNYDLTPTQERNLEKKWCCRVLDRTGLILDIFAQRARTHEGKLQVELAQLKHLATRLVRGWTHLERQKGGIGLRGPGETQLELDRRLINQRIATLQHRLRKVRNQRVISRQARHQATVPTVALIGYTNAGKSTLFNTLTQASVLATDQVFATLDPTLRRCTIDGLGPIVLADTVGFIKDLPHGLIEAFQATLEETRQAALLLHVVDRADPEWRTKMIDVRTVLQQIHADKVPELVVFNKIDLVEQLRSGCVKDAIYLSAHSQQGLADLAYAITQSLQHDILHGQLILAPQEAKCRSYLYTLGAVKHEAIDRNGNWILEVVLGQKVWHELCQSLPHVATKFNRIESKGEA